jgi:acetylornithine/N-succinyldiaminopimelate aminotransferase
MDALVKLKGKYPFVTEVRGRGFLVAIEFDKEIGQKVLLACLEKGLIVNRVKANAIRLVPPLIIGKKEVDEAVAVLEKVFSGIVGR